MVAFQSEKVDCQCSPMAFDDRIPEHYYISHEDVQHFW